MAPTWQTAVGGEEREGDGLQGVSAPEVTGTAWVLFPHWFCYTGIIKSHLQMWKLRPREAPGSQN